MSTLLPLPLVTALVMAAWAPARALPFDATTVEIVEFTDYQCPYCGRAEATLGELKSQYGPALRVVVKHQPLTFHAHARRSAEAAEAARNQARFDAMHERLFANPRALTPDDLVEHARAIGLDLERFKRDLASPEVAARVDRDRDIANAVGATGTPTFFINGRLLKGAQPVAAFRDLIDQEIKEAQRVNRRGDTWISDRLSANNPALWGYLRGGQIPPREAAPPEVADEEAADKTVYKVTVDPDVDAFDGPSDALVTLVEFLDYQCPYSKKLEATMADLMARYPGRVRRVVKHHPLSFHEAARPAAAAAICAQAQGRFWQMHEGLFADQQRLDAPSLKNRASAIGLDLAKFERCLGAASTEARVAADQALAGRVTATGTPYTFINGRKIPGAKSFESFLAVIEEELARAQAVLATRVASRDLYAALVKDGVAVTALDGQVFDFADGADTPVLGHRRAKVRLTVFADFQCPFSARLLGPLEEVVKRYRGKVAVAWRHFPLSFHPHAIPAAKAALCAQAQKKFWQAAAHLFGAQPDLAGAIPRLHEAIGLDAVKYLSCMNRNADGATIDGDLEVGRKAGVKGTPTVFIQGRRFTSPSGLTVEAFTKVIDALLAGREP
jgi:protein-disulfide isomerase